MPDRPTPRRSKRLAPLLVASLSLAWLSACSLTPPRAPSRITLPSEREAAAQPQVEQPPAAAPSQATQPAPSLTPGMQTSSWEALLEGYFSSADPEATLLFLHSLPRRPFTGEEIRLLLRAASLLERDHLFTLLGQQPPNSPLTPYLQLTLADKQATLGQGDSALQLWREVAPLQAAAPIAAREARLRLQPDGQQTPLRVGLLLPLTDRYAHLGKNLLQAAQLALAHFPDAALDLVVEDSAGSVQGAWTGTERLIEQNVQAIIGPVFHAPARAAAALARTHGVPLISLNPHMDIAAVEAESGEESEEVADAPRSPVFLNAFHPEHQARVMARFAIQRRGVTRMAILAPQSGYGELISQAFAEEVVRLGGAVARLAYFPGETSDFSPWIKALGHLDADSVNIRMRTDRRRIRLDPADPLSPQADGDLVPWADFQALFLPARADQVRLIAPQAAFYDLGTPDILMMGSALWNHPDLLLSEGTDYLRGAVFCDTDNRAREQFSAAYEAAWGQKPSNLAQLTYDSVAVLGQLLRDQRLGGPAWNTAFTRPSGFFSSSGLLRFLDDGQSVRQYFLYQVTRQGIAPLPPDDVGQP